MGDESAANKAVAAVGAAAEEGRVAPPHLSQKAEQRKSAIALKPRAKERAGFLGKLSFAKLESLDGLRCAPLAGFVTFGVALVQLTAAVLSNTSSAGLASFIVAEASSLFAMLCILPLFLPELRKNKLFAMLSLEFYVAMCCTCALFCLLYFLEGSNFLGFIGLGFAGGGVLFFLAWGESLARRSRAAKKRRSAEGGSGGESSSTDDVAGAETKPLLGEVQSS